MLKSNVIIWPISIRSIHWLVALIVILDAFIVDDGDALHRSLGYGAMVLVLVRLGQGIWGSGHVLLSSMPLAPSRVSHFLRNHFKGKAHYIGHNPLASWTYILMWGLIILLGITGWMMDLDAFWGDETLHSIHSQLSIALIGLVFVHILGILVDSYIYKRKTWMGMINGKEKEIK